MVACQGAGARVNSDSHGPVRRRPARPVLAAMLAISGTLAACARSDDGAPRAGDAVAASVCYRASGSALGRLPNDAGGATVGPGWIRLDGASADSGTALLVDADGASLGARWRSTSEDSIHVLGFDDFIRVEMRLVRADTGVQGRIHTTSDASLSRDSTGQLRSLDRTADVAARAAPCDSMPTRRNASAPTTEGSPGRGVP
jgi:hypothetical protein